MPETKTHRRSNLWLAATLLLAGAGCGEATSPTPAPDVPDAVSDVVADAAPDVGPPPECNQLTRLGSFAVNTSAQGGGLQGVILSGPMPHLQLEQQRIGGCAFHATDPPPFCDPPCEGGTLCAFDATCREYPSYLDAGTMTLSGPEPPITPTHTPDNVYYTEQPLPDLYQPGDPLTLNATGGADVAAFELQVAGVEALELENTSFTAHQGQDLVISWTPASTPSDALVRLHMDIDHHALVRAFVECEVPDAQGNLTVPAQLLDALIATGHSGIGTYIENVVFSRFTRDEVKTDAGCIRFESLSQDWLYIDTVLQ